MNTKKVGFELEQLVASHIWKTLGRLSDPNAKLRVLETVTAAIHADFSMAAPAALPVAHDAHLVNQAAFGFLP